MAYNSQREDNSHLDESEDEDVAMSNRHCDVVESSGDTDDDVYSVSTDSSSSDTGTEDEEASEEDPASEDEEEIEPRKRAKGKRVKGGRRKNKEKKKVRVITYSQLLNSHALASCITRSLPHLVHHTPLPRA